MPTIDLLNYVVAKTGNWVKIPDAVTSFEFILSEQNDEVTFTGPVALSVTLQSENRTLGPSGADEKLHFHDVYSYSLAVPPGHTWQYRFADHEAALRLLGVNRGTRVLIRPGYTRIPATVILPGTDLPCDFAVEPIANTGQFFPAGCEPCPPGVPVGLPPGATPTLVAPAPGGCVRTRFFNGMFITREDMETEQRFFRLKNKLQNRAMGQGVVWGLNLVRHADSICVEPGYAVDCCGNDLMVTEPYRVSIGALLRDPASFRFALDVAGRRKSTLDDCDDPVPPGIIVDPAPQLCRRMHLLLEFVECPQDARPVHGDPCSPEVTRCEMSRIRETVRLRLVPPRDYDPTGPIDKFLNEFKAILQEAGVTDATPGSTVTTATTLPVPFRIDVSVDPHPVLLPPGFTGSVQPDRTATRTLNLPNVQGAQTVPPLSPYNVRFKVLPAFGHALSEGQVVGAGNAVVATVNPGSAVPLEWAVSVPTFPAAGFPAGSLIRDVDFQFTIRDWRAAPATGQPVLTGSTLVRLSVRYTALGGTTAPVLTVNITWTAIVGPTEVFAVVPGLAPFPCAAEACGCDPDLLRFPVFPPFLHSDPRQTNQSVDWKVLVLAVLYGWLVSEAVRHRTGTPQATITPRLQLALNLYVVALRVLLGANTREQAERLTRAMRCLFQAWCRALLYPGPHCERGIHGVVIGCAQVHGGRIVEVDPWGGRRWVVHYPLLSYWGHQFGIAPLDLTASRLFSMICCLGGLPVPPLDPRQPVPGPNVPPAPGVAAGRANAPNTNLLFPFGTGADAKPVPVGQVFLVAGTRAEALKQLRDAGIVPAATRELELTEFVATLLLRLREQPSGPVSQYTLFALRNSPDIHFAAPLYAEAGAAAEAAVRPRPVVVDRLPDLVRAAADARTRATVPPLLRDLSEAVSASVLRIASIRHVAEEPKNPFHQRLIAAGVPTFGALLGRPAEEVHAALHFENSKELSEILQEGETVVSAVTKAVYSATAVVAKVTGAVSRRDLTGEENIHKLSEAVAEALSKEKRIQISRDAVAAVVEAAVHGSA